MNAQNPRRWWILGALMLALIVVGLDGTVLNVALPTLATSLTASTSQLQWIVDSYILVLAGLMLPVGALGDRIGRRRLLLAGLTLFVLGSLAAAYAGSAGMLIATRAVMGLGAAVLMTVPAAVIAVLFDEQERPKAIAAFAVSMGLGLPLGPIVGGWLLEHFWWGSVFLINLPLGVAAAVAVAVLLPESRDPDAAPVDPFGAVLSTAGLVALVYGVVEAPDRGWTSGTVLGIGGLGLVLLAGFAWWQTRTPRPMIDLNLFTRPRFGWGTLCMTLAAFAMLGLLFVIPQYLQAVRGHTPLATGVRLLPLIAGLVIGAPVAGRLTTRVGGRLPIATGLLLIAGALAWGSTIAVDTSYLPIGLWLGLTGVGIGLTMTPAMDAVLGEIPAQRAATGTALSMALRQVGGALGVAVLGSIANAGYTGRLDTVGLPAPAAHAASESISAGMAIAARLHDPALAASAGQAYVHAISLVMLTSAAIAVLGAVLAATVFPPHPAVPSQSDEESVRIEA